MPGPTLVDASVVDRTATGGRVCSVIGPLALHDPADIDRGFRRVAAAGSGNRFGLHPDSAQRWRFDPESPVAWSVRRESDDFSADGVDAALAAMMAEQCAEPISIRLHGDYALLSFDHGIGDAQFMYTVPTLLASNDGRIDTAVAQWPTVTVAHPLSAALRRAARTHPGRVVAEVATLVRNRGKAVDAGTPAKVTPLPAGPTTVSARSARGFTTTLRDAIPDRSSSTFAALARTTADQLVAHGIDLLPTAGAVVDLRRYLPDGAFTLQNFMSWLDIPTDPAIGASQLHALLQAELAAYRPLVGFGIGSALASRRKHIPAWTAWDVTDVDRARLSFSDFRSVPAVARFAWAPAAASYLSPIALPLGFRDQISVSLSALPDHGLQLAATFHADAFDSNRVRDALGATVADPRFVARTRAR